MITPDHHGYFEIGSWCRISLLTEALLLVPRNVAGLVVPDPGGGAPIKSDTALVVLTVVGGGARAGIVLAAPRYAETGRIVMTIAAGSVMSLVRRRWRRCGGGSDRAAAFRAKTAGCRANEEAPTKRSQRSGWCCLTLHDRMLGGTFQEAEI
jgi:hypothetical protein